MSDCDQQPRCIDCKFIVRKTWLFGLLTVPPWKYARCNHPESGIRGDYSYAYVRGVEADAEPPEPGFCAVMREFKCGREGRLFERRLTPRRRGHPEA